MGYSCTWHVLLLICCFGVLVLPEIILVEYNNGKEMYTYCVYMHALAQTIGDFGLPVYIYIYIYCMYLCELTKHVMGTGAHCGYLCM